jgi:GLPGLI family protein
MNITTMKKIIKTIITISVVSTVICHAQNTVTGVLKYNQITAFSDTLKRNLIPVELYFNAFESITKLGNIRNIDPNDTSKLITTPVDEKKKNAVYVNLKTNRMISRQKADTERVIVSDTLDFIDWGIQSQTRLIGNIKCQKAQAQVRGRYYTAWFAPEIPISLGPWKLHGLPGLILEAKSADNAVEFKFESLKMPDGNQTKIEPLPVYNLKVVNESAFLKLNKLNEENFMKMLASHPNFSSGNGTHSAKTMWIEVYPEK